MAISQRIALVTGTSSGIGAAVADALLGKGWTVVGMSRRPVHRGGSLYHHLQVDFGDLRALRTITDGDLPRIIRSYRWERLGLVNNAATIGPVLPLEQTNPEDLDQVFAINAVAPIHLMGFMVRRTPCTASLRIANVLTGAALQPVGGLSAYGASKAALRLASMVLAAELESNQRPTGGRASTAILSYYPGVADTPMQELARSADPPWNEPFMEFYAQGMLHPPEAPAAEIAEFLSGDDQELFEERHLSSK